jgi:hypothetical protein
MPLEAPNIRLKYNIFFFAEQERSHKAKLLGNIAAEFY